MTLLALKMRKYQISEAKSPDTGDYRFGHSDVTVT